MRSKLRRFYGLLSTEGPRKALRRGTEFGLRKLYLSVSDEPRSMFVDSISAIAEQQGINICYNEDTRSQYDPSMTNVLVVTEGPALVEADDWLDPSMDFHAEFSMGDFYGLNNFFSICHLHAGRDYRVALDVDRMYPDKPKLVSIVFADKDRFPGQAMRHRVAAEYGDIVDAYGSGVGEYLYEKSRSLDPYMFQVVVESGKYPEYVSEKFYDCLKTHTVPIYRGGREGIERLGFDTDGILFFENMEELGEILDGLSADDYERLRPHAMTNRERLVEIRNQMKGEFYIDFVRLGFLVTSDDERFEETRNHLRFE